MRKVFPHYKRQHVISTFQELIFVGQCSGIYRCNYTIYIIIRRAVSKICCCLKFTVVPKQHIKSVEINIWIFVREGIYCYSRMNIRHVRFPMGKLYQHHSFINNNFCQADVCKIIVRPCEPFHLQGRSVYSSIRTVVLQHGIPATVTTDNNNYNLTRMLRFLLAKFVINLKTIVKILKTFIKMLWKHR